MTLPQREHPDAVHEFDAALYWYENQEAGMGLALGGTYAANPERPRRVAARRPAICNGS